MNNCNCIACENNLDQCTGIECEKKTKKEKKMECNNCFASKDWNLINEYLFDKNYFSNIKLKKDEPGLMGEYIIYESICNGCKKSIKIIENLGILEHIDSKRKDHLIKLLNKDSTN